jgi:hypothetical protein
VRRCVSEERDIQKSRTNEEDRSASRGMRMVVVGGGGDERGDDD